MKYKLNGEWIDVNIKALDSMPVGSQLEFTGTEIPTGWEVANDYSTTEIDTGKKWIDGKKIYRKVIEDTTNPSANAWKSLPLTNIDHVISYSGELIPSSSEKFVLPMGSDTRAIWFRVTSNTLQEAHNTDYFNSNNIVLIVEYTKTTDQ